MEPTQPLVDRPAGATLFVTPERRIDAATFVAEASAVAAALPAHAHVINLCQNRYAFALGLAAALLRGQLSLLSGVPAPGMLARLAREYPDAYLLTDTPGQPPDPVPLPVHAVTVRAPAPPAAIPALPERQPAVVVLTSGSTGAPAATRKSWGELVARSRAAGERFVLHAATAATVLGTVPPGHMYGLETTVLLPLHAGAASWCGPGFYPADIAAALDALPGPRILVTTPLHLRALLRERAPARPPERVISATAPLDPDTALDAERRWGAEVFEIFGASEVGSIASRRSAYEAEWTLYPGLSLGERADGTLLLRAPHAEPRPLADRVTPSADGRRFALLGRSSDIVKLGGLRASLEGLRRTLLAVPGVEDAAFLAPDDLDENPAARLAAFAVAPSHTVASLLLALRAEVDPAFLPRPLVLLDALPRDTLGKLPRAALLAELRRRDRPA